MLQLRRQFEKSIMNSKFRSLKDKYHLWDNSTNVPTVDFNAFYNYLEKTICKYTGPVGSFFCIILLNGNVHKRLSFGSTA